MKKLVVCVAGGSLGFGGFSRLFPARFRNCAEGHRIPTKLPVPQGKKRGAFEMFSAKFEILFVDKEERKPEGTEGRGFWKSDEILFQYSFSNQ